MHTYKLYSNCKKKIKDNTHTEKKKSRSGEMNQSLRALATLPKVWCSLPGVHNVQLTTICNSSFRVQQPFPSLLHPHTSEIHINKNKNRISKRIVRKEHPKITKKGKWNISNGSETPLTNSSYLAELFLHREEKQLPGQMKIKKFVTNRLTLQKMCEVLHKLGNLDLHKERESERRG